MLLRLIAIIIASPLMASAAFTPDGYDVAKDGILIPPEEVVYDINDSLSADFSLASRQHTCTVRFFQKDDSAFMEFLPGMRFDYATIGRRPLIRCIEGRNWRIAPVVDSLSTGREFSDDMVPAMTLTRYNSESYLLNGSCSNSISYAHNIIMNPGDTLKNVTVWVREFNGVCKTTPASKLQDSIMSPIKIHRCDWYSASGGQLYAIYYDVEFFRTKQTGVVLFQTDDSEGRNILVEKLIFPSLKENGLAPEVMTNSISFPYSVEKSYDNVKVSIVSDCDASKTVSPTLMLTDLLGRVYPPLKINDREHLFEALPPGEYILTVSDGTAQSAQKIIILKN